jgi:hypothetical protein
MLSLVALMLGAGLAQADITITGTGKVKYRPDVAYIGLGVSAEADTAAEAWKKQGEIVGRLFALLRKLGIDEKDMKTTGVNLSPRYLRVENEPPQLIGYTATYNLTVSVRQLDLMGKVLDGAVESGANQNVSISFGCGDPEKMLDEARAAAIADARKRAELYAKGAGCALARVKTITEGSGSPWRRHQFDLAMPASREAAKALTVAAGEQELSVQVTVTWALRHTGR